MKSEVDMVTFKRYIGIEDYTTPTYWVVYRVFVDDPICDSKIYKNCKSVKYDNLIDSLKEEFKKGDTIYVGYKHSLVEDEIMFMHLSDVSKIINDKDLLSTIHYAGHRQVSMLACKGIKIMGLIQVNSAYLTAAMQNPGMDIFGSIDITYTQEYQLGFDLKHSKFIDNHMCNFMSDNESMAMRSAMLQNGGHDLKYTLMIYSSNIMKTRVTFNDIVGNYVELPQGLRGYVEITQYEETSLGNESEEVKEYNINMTKTLVNSIDCVSMKNSCIAVTIPEIDSGAVSLYGRTRVIFGSTNINWDVALHTNTYEYGLKMGELREFKGHISGSSPAFDRIEVNLDVINIEKLRFNTFKELSINKLVLGDLVKEIDNPFLDVIIIEFIVGRSVRFMDFSKSYFFVGTMILPPMEDKLSVWPEDRDMCKVDTLVAYYKDIDFLCEVFDLECDSYEDIENAVETDGNCVYYIMDGMASGAIKPRTAYRLKDNHTLKVLTLYYDYDVYMKSKGM